MNKLQLAQVVALLAASGGPFIQSQLETVGGDWPGQKPEPDNRGRRAEKDLIAIQKAEAKRQRKAAKRAMILTPNVQVQGRREEQ